MSTVWGAASLPNVIQGEGLMETKEFTVHAVKCISNLTSVAMEISDDGEEARAGYMYSDGHIGVWDWKEVEHDVDGRPFIEYITEGDSIKLYHDEFMRV